MIRIMRGTRFRMKEIIRYNSYIDIMLEDNYE